MAGSKTLCLGLTLVVFINSVTSDNVSTTVRCQIGSRLRKQIEAKPLGGRCLRDIVDELSSTFRSFGNEELGVAAFQEMLDKLEFTNVSSSLEAKLDMLVDKLDSKLKSYTEFLAQSNRLIQPILHKKQSHAIYPSQSVRIDLVQARQPDICAQISTALATNLRGHEWKYLHVLPMSQPGRMCGPPSLAHNIGPLLMSQCAQTKNVILLLEHSSIMSEGDLALAQMTAKTVIDMLSGTDYVMVVGLAGHSSAHCKGGLLRATDINKIQLARYIDSIIQTDSNQTFQSDFKTQHMEGEVVLIHLTNTLKETYNVKHIVDVISQQKLVVHLRTILILSEPKSYINIQEPPKNGIIITIPTQNVLGYDIARLFSGLNCTDDHKKDYHLSDPYFEPLSKIMTLSVGQITNASLLSLNVRLRDFVEDVTYFNAGPNAYAILFDKKSVVWMHKNFPRPETMTEQPLKVALQDIENINTNIVKKMISQVEGIIDIRTNLGEEKNFRWKHLAHGELIVCVVSKGGEEFLSVARTVPPLPSNILHHRLDLMLHSVVNKESLCSYQNRIATLHTGVVYLSPWCFQSPMEQLRLLETGSAVTVQSYMAYIKDSTRLLANPGLHPSVRLDVATLAQILDYFEQRHMHSLFSKFIVRRYVVAADSGVLEVYPGTVLDSGLDPKRRAWYGKAMEYPGRVILTSPYLDAGGAGYVVTLSHTVYEGRSTAVHSNTDPVLTVMSIDVTMGYISRLLLEKFPFCGDAKVKCFLMDDKGYLISHPSLMEPTNKVEQQHLTHKEVLVANDILNHEFFVKKQLCASHLDGTAQRYYKFNTSLGEVLTNIVHGEHCVMYQVAAVPGTNVFLGVVNATCNLLTAFCPCNTMDRLCLHCLRMEQTECECPCECPLYSGGCSQFNSSTLEPCPAPYEQGPSLQAAWAQTTALKSCATFNCKIYETMMECLGVVGCQWCHIDSDGETPLQTPYCSDQSSCFRGIFGSLTPYGDGTYNSHSTDEVMVREWPSVGPVAGGILAFLLVLGITIYCYRLRTVQSGLEHQCLHLHTAPDTLRMSPLDGDGEPMELDQSKSNMDTLLRDGVAPISPYRVSTNYRRPPGGDSDHGYSTMTPHDDSEQQTFAEPLLLVGGSTEPDLVRQTVGLQSPTTYLGSPHHVLAPVTVHRNMETNYC